MKIFTIKFSLLFTLVMTRGLAYSQTPVAGFSVSPNPVCAGQVLQITDLSTGTPSSWSYTVSGFGPGGGNVLSTQNPTVILNGQGVFSISLVASNGSGSSAPVVHTVQVLPAPAVAINPANQTSCIGGSVNSITVTQAGPGGGGASYTYSWSTGSTASILTIPAPSVTTVYSCVITSTNGCSATRFATVNIGIPTVSVTSAPLYICVGSGSTLTATGSGGGPYTYTWSNAATTRTNNVSTPGVYNVTVTNGVGCTGTQSYTLAASSTVAVNVTATPGTLCAGNTATLRATGATSYTWSNGATASSTTLSPGSTSSYTVIASTGTCVGTASVTINVVQPPSIVAGANPSQICKGQSTTLTATGADNFTWTAGVGTGTQVVVSPTTSTTYTVRGVNQGCAPKTSTVAVTVSLAPVINIASNTSLACAGDEIALAASGASSYTWTNNGATGGIILIQPMVTTVFTVTGSNGSCSSTATITQIVSDCTGLRPLNITAGQIVYPNPANSNISVQGFNGEVMILNLQGQVVLRTKSAGVSTVIDITSLSPGIYFISNGVSQQKLIVER